MRVPLHLPRDRGRAPSRGPARGSAAAAAVARSLFAVGALQAASTCGLWASAVSFAALGGPTATATANAVEQRGLASRPPAARPARRHARRRGVLRRSDSDAKTLRRRSALQLPGGEPGGGRGRGRDAAEGLGPGAAAEAEERGLWRRPRGGRRVWRALLVFLAVMALIPTALPSAAMTLTSTAPELATVPQVLSFDTVAKFCFAGGAGCCISHASATPLDVVKTRQQYDPLRYRHQSTGQPLSVLATGLQIMREEGPGMLLQGLGATAVGYLVQGGLKYSLWEIFKVCLGYGVASGGWRIFVLVVAAFGADLFASLALCPFERSRIRLVSDPNFATGPLPAFLRLLREDGIIGGLYGEGMVATLLKQQAYTIAKLTTFTVVLEALASSLWLAASPRLLLTVVSSLLAGFVAAIVSQPFDTLQVSTSVCGSSDPSIRLGCPVDFDSEGDSLGPPTALSIARALGLKGLFKGWRARLLQVEVIVVSQLIIYDCIKNSVGL